MRRLQALEVANLHVVVTRFNRWSRLTVQTIGRVLGAEVDLTLPEGRVAQAPRELDTLTERFLSPQDLQKEG